MGVNLRAEIEKRMLHSGSELEASFQRYAMNYETVETATDDRLKAVSIAVSDRLSDNGGQIGKNRLSEIAAQLDISTVSLLLPSAGGYIVKASSDSAELGRTYDLSKYRLQVVGANPNPEESFKFWSGTSGQPERLESRGFKRSFYANAKQSYIISCVIRDAQPAPFEIFPYTEPGQRGGSYLLEISAFNPDMLDKEAVPTKAEAPTVEQMKQHSLIFGIYTYRVPGEDLKHIREAAQTNRHVFDYDSSFGGRALIKTFLPVQGPIPYVIGLVMDKKSTMLLMEQQRTNEIYISAILLLAVVICSYFLSDLLLRPLRTIVWKVNEVSFGRFDESIKVKRKDELGLLAERVNTMSKNLGMYTNKLKSAFEENRSMKEYLESFIHHTTDAIHVTDLDGRITRVNEAFEELFGYSAEEAAGIQLPLVPDHLKDEEQQIVALLIAGEPLAARETIRVTKDGRWLDVSVTTSPIRDKYGVIHAIANITRDMTVRNKMEELLRRSEKLTTVGQLAAGVAHEIRNPLTTLRGFLQLQQQTNKLNPRHIDLMLSELDRINLIVGEFLILAKPQATRFEVKDVRYILGDVVSLLDSQAHLCNIIIVTRYMDKPCLVSCEENQLKQVFINVLKNAIEAMPSGGEIHIAVSDEAGQAAVTITDSGVGIPEEMIAKLGDPFITGKETGTGLGIMVSQRIIQSHHGAMDIRSKVGQGTTVTITLPLLQAAGGTYAEIGITADYKRKLGESG